MNADEKKRQHHCFFWLIGSAFVHLNSISGVTGPYSTQFFYILLLPLESFFPPRQTCFRNTLLFKKNLRRHSRIWHGPFLFRLPAKGGRGRGETIGISLFSILHWTSHDIVLSLQCACANDLIKSDGIRFTSFISRLFQSFEKHLQLADGPCYTQWNLGWFSYHYACVLARLLLRQIINGHIRMNATHRGFSPTLREGREKNQSSNEKVN